MEIFAQVVAGLLTLGVGALGAWVWNISGKVTTLEAKESAALLLAAVKEDSLKALLEEKFKGVEYRLSRIEFVLNGSHSNGE